MAYTSQAPRTALIATLGGKPQVVTFALDALLTDDASIERLCVVHLSARDPRIQHSLEVLQADLRAVYGARAPRFESVPIHAPPRVAQGAHAATKGRPIDSVDDPAAPEAIWMTLHRLIVTLHAEGYIIHLCLTGGPRLIALQALSAATLLLTPQDHCWHLYMPPALRDAAGEGQIMHAPDQPRLIPVPLLPLGMFIPGLQQAALQSPDQILAAGRQWMSAQDEQRCREVMRRLTPRQRDVLRELSRPGARPQLVAKRLNVSVSTVNSHHAVIRAECRNAWGLGPTDRVDVHFLREHFGSLANGFWEQW
ncbi:MAG: CRISPR-associated ring nuclease [Candidatus Roseilinea sp.]